jgi:hypothetical protein
VAPCLGCGSLMGLIVGIVRYAMFFTVAAGCVIQPYQHLALSNVLFVSYRIATMVGSVGQLLCLSGLYNPYSVKHKGAIMATPNDILPANADKLVVAARRLATHAHRGQTEWGGNPFIDHPTRIAAALTAAGQPCDVVAAGWLHDTVEDTSLTILDLRVLIGADVADTVSVVTRTDDQTYMQFTDASSVVPKPTVVKIADVNDHLEPGRIVILASPLKAKAISMSTRYKKALKVLVPACLSFIDQGLVVPESIRLVNRANELLAMDHTAL